MVVDALAPYVARTSAPMILTMQNAELLILHEEGFQLPVPYPCGRMISIIDGSGHKTVAVLLHGFAIS